MRGETRVISKFYSNVVSYVHNACFALSCKCNAFQSTFCLKILKSVLEKSVPIIYELLCIM